MHTAQATLPLQYKVQKKKKYMHTVHTRAGAPDKHGERRRSRSVATARAAYSDATSGTDKRLG